VAYSRQYEQSSFSEFDEKHSVVNTVLLAELCEKLLSKNAVCRRFKLCVNQFICLRIDSGVQRVLLIVESDHGLVDRNMIRVLIIFRL